MKIMKNRILAFVLVLTLTFSLAPLSFAEEAVSPPRGEVLAGAASDLEKIEALTTEAPAGSEFQGYIVRIRDSAIDAEMVADAPSDLLAGEFFVVEKPEDVLDFARPEDVEYIEPDMVVRALSYPDDANDTWFESRQWDLKSTGAGIYANAAWRANLTGAGITVAVVDTGINRDHEDFIGGNLETGWTFTTDSNNVKTSKPGAIDDNHHGSHVSSTIAANTNNSLGIAGIVPGVSVLPIKCLKFNGAGVMSDLILSLNYAKEQGADVVNCSLGETADSYGYGPYRSLQEKINELYAAGIIVVAAAGNDSSAIYNFPAACGHVVGVGSVGENGNRAGSSNYNNSVTVAAPGVGIYGFSHGASDSYITLSGTSMATPHVAALAVVAKQLAKRQGRSLNTDQFKNLLEASATDKGTPGYDAEYGYGIIDVERYINVASGAAIWDKATNGQEAALPDTDPAYNINYVLNGGTLPPGTPTTYHPSSAVTFPTPTRVGYEFLGWFNVSGRQVSGLPIHYYGDYTATAKWGAGKVITYTLDWNGATPTGSSSFTFTNGDVVSGLPSPTRTGYDFVGWYTARTGGTLVYNGQVVSADDDTTLYARWSPRTVYYFLNVNGGAAISNSILTFLYGDPISGLPKPTRTGYDFVGWYTDKTGGTQVKDGQVVQSLSAVTLYAWWAVESRVIRYTLDWNGGTPTGSSSFAFNNGDVVSGLPSPTRTGYDFVGWYTDRTGGTLVYNGQVVSADGDTTLYARWSPRTVYYFLNVNGGAAISNSILTFFYGGLISGLPKPTRPGYEFVGWYTDRAGGAQVRDGQLIQSLDPVTLYARWAAGTGVVRYTLDWNGGTPTGSSSYSFNNGDVVSGLPRPIRAGYEFVGWYTGKTGGTLVENGQVVNAAGDTTLYARWSPRTTYYFFDVNGGETIDNNIQPFLYDGMINGLPTPRRMGYDFKGWFTARTGGIQVTNGQQVKGEGAVYLYARWAVKTIRYSLDGNGAPVTWKGKLSFFYGDSISGLPNPTRKGYNFKGWFTARTGGSKVTNGKKVNTEKDVTLYARWTAKSYQVTLKVNGGKKLKKAVYSISYGTKYGKLPTPKKVGYRFTGWYTKKTGGTKVTAGSAMKKTAAHNLYAHWKKS